MEAWLAEHLESLTLTEESQNYLLSRGVREEYIPKLGFKTWSPATTAAPDQGVFKDRYKAHGEDLRGWLIVPIYCPRGKLLGFEGRKFPDKLITRYLLGRAEWNPVWYGIQLAMPHIWQGKSPWIFEGYFDVEVMRHVQKEDVPLLGSFRAKLTDSHVEFLRRMLPPKTEITMVYDNDETGRTGIRKATFALREVGLKCRPLAYKGKDPNKVWEERGVQALREQFQL